MAFALLAVLAACDHGGTVDGNQARTGPAMPVAPAPAVVSASSVGPTSAVEAASNKGAATFNYPSGIATDSVGDVYVADTHNHTIRKITPAGVVTTIAGTAGVEGHADGSAAAAQFNQPGGVAADSAGNIYVADTGNNIIRKITPAGVVTTIAGTAGVEGHADGSVAAAQFNQPGGVAADGAGNIYVADTGNNTIRKITPSGVVTTIAGTAGVAGLKDGMGAAARFDQPVGIATDSAANVYVCDSNAENAPRKITPAGKVTTIKAVNQEWLERKDTGMDPGGDTIERLASMVGPAFGIAFDKQGNAYVASDDGYVRKITPQGDMKDVAQLNELQAGSEGGSAKYLPAHLRGIAIDSAGNIYVSKPNDHTIGATAETGGMTSRILAGTAGKAGHADSPGASAAANGAPSSAIAVATAGDPKDVQADEGANVGGENCEAHWPGCPCPKDLSPILDELHITPPKGMSLLEGSCSRQGSTVAMGSFTFAGEMTIKDMIRYEAGDMFDSITFAGFRVEDDPRLHVPPLSENERCLAAPAEIKIKGYQVLIGGTDEEGTWMRGYEVVKLGKYGKCGPRVRRHR